MGVDLNKLIDSAFNQSTDVSINCKQSGENLSCQVTVNRGTTTTVDLSQNDLTTLLSKTNGWLAQYGNIATLNSYKRDSEGRWHSLFSSNPGFNGNEHVRLNFVDTNNDPKTFEVLSADILLGNIRSTLSITLEPNAAVPITDFANKAFDRSREVFLGGLQQQGKLVDIKPQQLDQIYGPKPDGTKRKVVFIFAHEDDEVGAAGMISRLIEKYGRENVSILFTTNGDGLAWDEPDDKRMAYGETKMDLGRKSCERFGVLPENCRMLGVSEYEYYNSFISANYEKLKREGKPIPKDVPKDFKPITNPVPAEYYMGEWVYRNLVELGADVVVTGDQNDTVQAHDKTYELTLLATAQYRKDAGKNVLLLAMPQQNINPQYNDRLLYAFYPSQLINGGVRVVLDDKMRDAKDKTIKTYQVNPKDKFLFLDYWFRFGAEDTANMQKYEQLRIVGSDTPRMNCPPRDQQGIEVFEGNNDHLGIEHHCEDDHASLPALIKYIKAHPFTMGPIKPFDRSLWYLGNS